MIHIGDLVHFELDGWSILSDYEINQEENEISRMIFLTLTLHNGEPRVIYSPYLKEVKQPDLICQLVYEEIPDLRKLQKGDKVYYMEAKFNDDGKRDGSKILFGTITSINFDTQNVIINHQKTAKLLNVMSFQNNFDMIKDSGAYICRVCRLQHKDNLKKFA